MIKIQKYEDVEEKFFSREELERMFRKDFTVLVVRMVASDLGPAGGTIYFFRLCLIYGSEVIYCFFYPAFCHGCFLLVST